MIAGQVSDDGVPYITLRIADRDWRAVVDTGFNGHLELPGALFEYVDAELIGQIMSDLAGGVTVDEDLYEVTVPFDGLAVRVTATFTDTDTLLLGTWMLVAYRLAIDFPKRIVRIDRVADQ